MFDFKANERKSMSMIFPAGISRGGAAYYLAPEITTANQGKPVELNYTKADVWSLGMILAQMMCDKDLPEGVDKKTLLTTATDRPMTPISTAIAITDSVPSLSTSSSSGALSVCKEVVTKTLTSVTERWSCYDVYSCVTR
jgi:serine/threonine protein kinase